MSKLAPIAARRTLEFRLVTGLAELGLQRVAAAQEAEGNVDHSHGEMSKPVLELAPALAHRLWSGLFCMCGECERMLLSDCGCDEAAKQRRRIADAVTKLAPANPEAEVAVYKRVVDDYVAGFGSNAELAYVRRHAWRSPSPPSFSASPRARGSGWPGCVRCSRPRGCYAAEAGGDADDAETGGAPADDAWSWGDTEPPPPGGHRASTVEPAAQHSQARARDANRAERCSSAWR